MKDTEGQGDAFAAIIGAQEKDIIVNQHVDLMGVLRDVVIRGEQRIPWESAERIPVVGNETPTLCQGTAEWMRGSDVGGLNFDGIHRSTTLGGI